MTIVRISTIAGAEGLQETATLRREVFIEEQRVPEDLEWDDDDTHALHYVAKLDGRVVGVARMTRRSGGDTVKLQRLAVSRDARSRNIGASLVRAMIDDARRMRVARVVLDAQVQVVAFYERLGFQVTGAEFMDAGIPHVPMELLGDIYACVL